MADPILPAWTLLFYDGTKQTVTYDPGLRIEKPEGLYSYVRGDGSDMTHTPAGWEPTERDTGPTEYPPTE